METVVTPDKIVSSWDEIMTSYTIKVGDKEYTLNDDFSYTGHAVYTVWNPTGEIDPILGIPVGETMQLEVYYMYNFSAVEGGIEGVIKMHAIVRFNDVSDFFVRGNMKIQSLWGTGDLRDVKIWATNGGTGGPSHVGTACNWPDIVTLTGTYDVFTESNPPDDPWGPYATTYEKGDKLIVVWRDLPLEWGGDVTGAGTYRGVWVISNFGTEEQEVSVYRSVSTIQNGEFTGIGTGNLVLRGVSTGGFDYAVAYGTGDLRGTEGTMMLTPLSPVNYQFTMDLKFK